MGRRVLFLFLKLLPTISSLQFCNHLLFKLIFAFWLSGLKSSDKAAEGFAAFFIRLINTGIFQNMAED